jgi:hypothetical protein
MAIDLSKTSSFGDTVEDYVATIPYEADGDGEGLWGIVPAGRSFGYEGAELQEFVRLCILSILKAGGLPVRHAQTGPLEWEEQKQYGTEGDQIAGAIIAEWQAAGGGDPPWEWLYFVTQRVLATSQRWQADQGSKP